MELLDYEGEIIEIAVLPNYRNNGYAQLLINNFVKFLSGKEFLYLEVRENNIKAIELYKKIGFEQYNIRKHYYRDGVNAILFRKKLISWKMKSLLELNQVAMETAVAVLKNRTELLANVVSSQIKTHMQFGGVMPEIASRLHLENVGYTIKAALDESKII